MFAYDFVVGSIASVAAVVVAIAAIYIPQAAARRKEKRDDAAHARAAIKDFQGAAHHLISLLQDGSALIGSAGTVTDYVRTQLPNPPSIDDVWRFLENPGATLRSSVTGFASNDLSQAVVHARGAMVAAGQELADQLAILSTAGALVVRIHDDGSVSTLFSRLLAPEPLALFKRDSASSNAEELLSELASFLQSNAAMYFAARYERALSELRSFIDVASAVLTRLDEKELHKLVSALPAVDSKGTYTSDMRSGVLRLLHEHVLAESEGVDLLDTVANIERLIAKDGALERAVDLTSQGDLQLDGGEGEEQAGLARH